MTKHLHTSLLRLSVAFALVVSFANALAAEKEPLIRKWVFPARAKEASPRMVDLSQYYTAALDDDWLVSAGANLKSLPKGLQKIGPTTFDIRGIIQLGSTSLYEASDYSPAERKIKYPAAVNGIKVQQAADSIAFLHASAWGAKDNEEVGQYIVHYADGSTETIALKYLDSLRDWWFKADEKMPTAAEQSWTGLNDLTQKLGFRIALFTFRWKNPQPKKVIASIDYRSTMTTAAPFLVAMTLD